MRLSSTRPPVAIIEVLSPEDRVSRYQQRLDDYRAMGVANVWVIDPMRRKAFDCSQGGWQPVDKLVMANPPVEIPLDPLWKKLTSCIPRRVSATLSNRATRAPGSLAYF